MGARQTRETHKEVTADELELALTRDRLFSVMLDEHPELKSMWNHYIVDMTDSCQSRSDAERMDVLCDMGVALSQYHVSRPMVPPPTPYPRRKIRPPLGGVPCIIQ